MMEILDNCGCCESSKATPSEVNNRPSLSAIAYRIGTYSTFRQTMLHEIYRNPGLSELKTRIDGDYAVTILDLWAIIADVLTFYQERIANEAFLRTATQRDSVLRLARLLDSQLRPGAAATAFLAFTVEKDKKLRIPERLRVQSVPGQDGKPQKFETVEAINADSRFNVLRILPAPARVNPFEKGTLKAYLAPGKEGLEAAKSLAAGDRTVIINSLQTDIEELSIKNVSFEEDRMLLEWSSPIQGSWGEESSAYRFKRKYRLFGYNAPAKYIVPIRDKNSKMFSSWENWDVDFKCDEDGSLYLDGQYEGFKPGSNLLVSINENNNIQNYLVTVSKVEPSLKTVRLSKPQNSAGDLQDALGLLSGTVTHLRIFPPSQVFPQLPLNGKDCRNATVYEIDMGPILLWGYDYADISISSQVYLSGMRIAEDVIEVGRTITKKGCQSGTRINLKDIEIGRTVIVHDGAHAPIISRVSSARIWSSGIDIKPTSVDKTSASELGFGSAEPVTGLVSKPLSPFPTIRNANNPEISISIGSVGPVTVSLGSMPAGQDDFAKLRDAANKLQTGIKEAARKLQSDQKTEKPAPELDQARVLTVNSCLLVLAGVPGTTINIKQTTTDSTTFIDLGLNQELAHPIFGLRSQPLKSVPAFTNQSPEISISVGPMGPRKVNLLSILQLTNDLKLLYFIFWILACDGNFDPSSPALGPAIFLWIGLIFADFSYYAFSKKSSIEKIIAILISGSRVLIDDDRLLILSGIVGYEPQEFLVLGLDPSTGLNLDWRSSILRGNVALASHGETIKNEVMGDGNASMGLQHFQFKKKPVTFIPTSDPGGIKSSLQVLVNGVRWNEVPSLYGRLPSEQIYTTFIDDDATMNLQFGDGTMGARLPSGKGNIVATYRQGLGLSGRVGANTLTTLLDRYKGLKAVSNPAPSEGGADPETLDQAKKNAPTTVKTFGRAVSIKDFEDLATASGEVAKAKAIWVWNGEAKALHLTVAGQMGSKFSREYLKNIHASITTQRDPNHTLLIDNFVQVPIVINALIKVSDNYVAAEVAGSALDKLLRFLSFESIGFAQTIHLSDIYRILQDISGVSYVDIDLLQFKDRSIQNLKFRGASDNPVQEYLRIFPARYDLNTRSVSPAEQAFAEVESQDITVQTSGGLPS